MVVGDFPDHSNQKVYVVVCRRSVINEAAWDHRGAVREGLEHQRAIMKMFMEMTKAV